MKLNKFVFLPFLISFTTYIFFNLFVERQYFELLFLNVSVLFIFYILLIQNNLIFSNLLIIGILFRCTFLLEFPILSDDYFRFLWDGHLLSNSINPYKFLPSEIVNLETNAFLNSLYPELNSKNYFSVYPPVSQLIFYFSSAFNDKFISIFVMRLILIIFDIISLIYIRKLLKIYNLNIQASALYFLNPLIIIECVGNVHFEGVMISFFLVSWYSFKKNNFFFTSLFYALSIATKLLSVIFLLVFIYKNDYRNNLKMLFLLSLFLMLFFVPFLSIELILKIFSSINLYFQSFEFNASMYYILRWAGYMLYGYNTIKSLGVLLGVCSLLSILFIVYKSKDLIEYKAFFLMSFVYLLFTTTVHPWYLSFIVLFSVFVPYRFAIVWSYLVFLSYSCYSEIPYQEKPVLIFLEYILVFLVMIFEIYKKTLGFDFFSKSNNMTI